MVAHCTTALLSVWLPVQYVTALSSVYDWCQSKYTCIALRLLYQLSPHAVQVKSKHMVAAHAVYARKEGLSVHEAVSLARGSAAAATVEEAQAAEIKKGKKKFWERKGCVGTRDERTLSGRTDSATSLDQV